MAALVKNKELIVSKTSNSKNGVDYVIKNTYKNAEVKLGDVFNYLPAGVIDKTETGIGGTSCEINSERNSIIVQPYTTTAYNKAQFKPAHQAHNVHFFGTSKIKTNTQSVKGKINTINIFSVSQEEKDYNLREYLESVKPGTPIKITCVTDQLEALRDMMEAHEPGLFSSCHLVLDEIDCFQEHSNFRPVMDKSIQIYKDHPKDKRSLISATIKEFIDPILKSEPLTSIKYQKPQKKTLQIIQTSYYLEECFQVLCKIANLRKGEKVVVALNLIKDCLSLAITLQSNQLFKSTSIMILCSESSAKKVGDLFGVLTTDGKLPADINIVTSAYFNGVDINERYHNIIISNGIKPTLRLSSSLIYQISGRCRKKLYSNILIVNIKQQVNYITYSLNELIEQADEQINIYNAISALKRSKYENTIHLADSISEILENGYKSYLSFCYINTDQQCLKSYLKLESRLEQQTTFEKYSSSSLFLNDISQRFAYKLKASLYKKDDPKNIVKEDIKTEGLKIMSLLMNLKPTDKIRNTQKNTQVFNSRLSVLFDIFETARLISKINFHKLELLITNILNGKQINLTPLLVYLEFHSIIIQPESTRFLNTFSTYFPINKTFITEDMDKTAELYTHNLKTTKKIKQLKELLEKNPKLIKNGILKVDMKGGDQRKSTIVNYEKFDIFN